MNGAKKLLLRASTKLELPSDVIVGVPRIEILGKSKCCIEPQRGLLEYSEFRICVSTDVGVVQILGENMRIIQMNSVRIVVTGVLDNIGFMENHDE